MDRSPGFGSTSYNFFALFRLDFSSAPYLKYLTSLHNVTRWTVLQKVRYRTYKVLYLLVNIGFQVLFHSPPGVLFTFPSRYFSTIGHRGVFSLGGWSLRLPTRFLVSGCTLDPTVSTHISFTGLSPSLVMFPNIFYYTRWITSVVRNPGGISTSGLGSFAFARRYLQNRFFFLLLWVLRCFSSPRLPAHTLCIHVWSTGLFLPARFPHSDSHGFSFICNSPWIIAAYRVLLRLSVPRHSPYALCSLTSLTIVKSF